MSWRKSRLIKSTALHYTKSSIAIVAISSGLLINFTGARNIFSQNGSRIPFVNPTPFLQADVGMTQEWTNCIWSFYSEREILRCLYSEIEYCNAEICLSRLPFNHPLKFYFLKKAKILQMFCYFLFRNSVVALR